MKIEKKLLGFSFYINIGNFEAFLPNLNLSVKHLFWRCVQLPPTIKLDPLIFQITLYAEVSISLTFTGLQARSKCFKMTFE